MYEYKAKITNVVDGDTYDFEIDLGFGIIYKNRLRLYGVNTPEKRGPEKFEGIAVTEQVKKLIEGKDVTLHTRKFKGKYGRYIADVAFTLDYELLDLGRYLLKHDMAEKVNYA